MIVAQKIQGVRGLADFFRGATVAAGVTGANTAGSPVLTDINASFVSDGVMVGDRVWISGEIQATVFLVQSVDSETQVTLDTNVVNANLADAHYRVTKPYGFGDPADLKLFSTISGDHDTFLVLYEEQNF